MAVSPCLLAFWLCATCTKARSRQHQKQVGILWSGGPEVWAVKEVMKLMANTGTPSAAKAAASNGAGTEILALHVAQMGLCHLNLHHANSMSNWLYVSGLHINPAQQPLHGNTVGEAQGENRKKQP